MRRVLFGIDFWVKKSRKIKLSRAKGLNALSTLGRINRESEMYTCNHIKDPVLDKRGYPIKNEKIKKDKQKSSNNNNNNNNTNTVTTANNNNQQNIGDLNNNIMNSNSVVKRKQNVYVTKSYIQSFSLYKIEITTFINDFPEIVQKRIQLKIEKINKLLNNKNDLEKLSPKVYEQIFQIFNDYTYEIKTIRLSFEKWIDVFGIKRINSNNNNNKGTINSEKNEK